MTDKLPRNPASPASSPNAPRFEIEEWAAPPAFDATTFDPNEFEWRPVPRRPRADGWTPEVQQAFIQALADTGMVEEAARAVDMSVQSAYRLRHAPGAESFARAWHAALAAAAERVLDLAFARAIKGEDTPVFDRDGHRIGAKWRTNDRLTMYLLRAYMPDRFGHAGGSESHRVGRGVAAALPVADAIAALSPPVPPAPHTLLLPSDLPGIIETARAVADASARYPADDRERYVYPRVEGDRLAGGTRRRHRRAGPDPAEQEDDP